MVCQPIGRHGNSGKLLLAAFAMALTSWAALPLFGAEPPAGNWHQWRGPLATGEAPAATPPKTWSETENVRWKVAIDGKGGSSPIVWQDRLLLITAIDTGKVDPSLTPPSEQPRRPFGITYPNTVHQYIVLCLDRNTGRELWRRVVAEQVPAEGHHHDNDFASASPTTDGQRIYAWFGSAGMACLDMDGRLLWRNDLGPAETRRSFGEGSSPVVHDGHVILTRDQEGQSKIVVWNAADGKPLWQKQRDEPSCWATPLVVQHAGRTQVITNGHRRVRSYDLRSGELIWECGGQVSNVIPSPVSNATHVFCMSGYRGASALAMPLDASGDITDTSSIAWRRSTGTPYVPSPLLYRGLLYYNQTNSAIMTVVDATTGDVVADKRRLPGLRGMYASPVAADGRVYVVGRRGTTLVLKAEQPFDVLATNQLDEHFDASPAIVGAQLFLRGEKYMYCLEDLGSKN